MSMRAVLWDYGGVLVHIVDETPHQQLAEQVGKPLDLVYKLVFESQSSMRAALGEITSQQHWENVATELRLRREELPAFVQKFWSADGLDGDLIGYIRTLRSRYKVGLLSNAWDDLRQYLRERWKIEDAFDDVVISAEVGLVKPDPHIYHLAVERLGVAPEEAVFLDDAPENVEGARHAGLHAIQFTQPDQARQDLQTLLDGFHHLEEESHETPGAHPGSVKPRRA